MKPATWMIGFQVFLCGLLLLVLACPSPGGPQHSELVLEDEHSGVWMNIDNAFTAAANDDEVAWEKRNGVLIQLGYFWEYIESGPQQASRKKLYEFNKIIVEADGFEPLTIGEDDFDWLDIVGKYPGYSLDPMSLPDSDRLYQSTRVSPPPLPELPCSVIDTCPQDPLLALPGTCTESLQHLAHSCLRLRSLHAHFAPSRIITYWLGRKGYDLIAKQELDTDEPPPDKHLKYTFSFNDKIESVSVWLDGQHNTAIEDEIRARGQPIRIRILEPSDITHGDLHDPPTSGGQIPPPPGGGM